MSYLNEFFSLYLLSGSPGGIRQVQLAPRQVCARAGSMWNPPGNYHFTALTVRDVIGFRRTRMNVSDLCHWHFNNFPQTCETLNCKIIIAKSYLIHFMSPIPRKSKIIPFFNNTPTTWRISQGMLDNAFLLKSEFARRRSRRQRLLEACF